MVVFVRVAYWEGDLYKEHLNLQGLDLLGLQDQVPPSFKEVVLFEVLGHQVLVLLVLVLLVLDHLVLVLLYLVAFLLVDTSLNFLDHLLHDGHQASFLLFFLFICSLHPF